MRSPSLNLPTRFGARWAVLSLVGAIVALGGCSPAPEVAAQPAPVSHEPILSAMESLESASDAKCDSTASRFEDFVYGTPLADDAREEKIRLQKRFVAGIWGSASDEARRGGEATISRARVQPYIDELLKSEELDAEAIRVTPRGGRSVDVSRVRLRQYSSIAYSLRALLAVQQDVLLEGGDTLVPLEQEGIDALCRGLDLITLAALQTADEGARAAHEVELGGERFRGAWLSLLPEVAGSAAPDTPASTASSGEGALALLRGLIEEKQAAYQVYNELGKIDIVSQFLSNVAKFYARYPVPKRADVATALLARYDVAMDRFIARLLDEVEKNARARGETIGRSEDARAAIRRVLPAVIDDFEDVTVFPRLGGIVLESYDCDAYRDMGFHWRYLGRAYPEGSSRLPLDPFAAEIITESISQYGVLVLRVAGDVARERRQAPVLLVPDLEGSEERLVKLAADHEAAPERAAPATRIVSSAAGASRPEGRYFRDGTAASGITFHHRSSRWLNEWRRTQMQTAPTFSGGGVAAEDIDGDGDFDLFFAGGAGNALLLNDGSGNFRDVTEEAGVRFRRADGTPGEARHPLFADLDNDGHQDLIVTYAVDAHRVYRNRGDGTFEDRTAQAKLGGADSIGGPAVVFDFDQDGLLDVYITYFGDYLNGALPKQQRHNDNALPNRLFRNLGGMRFENVTEGSGTDDTGWSQGVSHTDFDRDGLQDIIVANDFGRNAYLRNLGKGKFENVAERLGLMKAYHSMNVGITDLNRDDFPDIYISNIAMMTKDSKYVLPDFGKPLDFSPRSTGSMLVKESNMLYMSQVDDTGLSGYVASTEIERGPSSTGWAWDGEFFDFDNDGDDDLYVVNGWNDYNIKPRVWREVSEEQTEYYVLTFGHESNVFYVNDQGKLKNVSPVSGADFAGNSRSTAYLDLEGDGDLDIAVNNFQSAATVLENVTDEAAGNWLKVRLVGDPSRGSNRDAIGARLLATAPGGVRVYREIQGGSGYMSMNPKESHIGVGAVERVDVKVTWPNGEVQTLERLAVNRTYEVRQASGEVVEVARKEARPSVAAR